VTQHRIDSYDQSQPLCRDVAREMFVPCVELDESPVACIWHVFRSELSLFVLHVATLVFGIVKASGEGNFFTVTECVVAIRL